VSPLSAYSLHQVLGVNLDYGGDFEAAREQFETAIAAYNSTSDHRDYELRNSFVDSYCHLGDLLSRAGFLDQGVATMRRGLEPARELTDAHLLAWELEKLAVVHQMRGEIDETLAAAEEVASLAEEHGFPGALWFMMRHRAWAMPRKGQVTHNVALRNQGLEMLKIADDRLGTADIALLEGDAKAGLATLDVLRRSPGIFAEGEEGPSEFYISPS
jgi:tetratricopeptide (TPR) repeat protein